MHGRISHRSPFEITLSTQWLSWHGSARLGSARLWAMAGICFNRCCTSNRCASVPQSLLGTAQDVVQVGQWVDVNHREHYGPGIASLRQHPTNARGTRTPQRSPLPLPLPLPAPLPAPRACGLRHSGRAAVTHAGRSAIG
jgi:hypothetical protein